MTNAVFTDIFDGNLTDNNTTTGTNLDDVILGDNGNDFLTGLAGNDLLFGNNGNDRIDGGLGNDEINGGLGNDTIDGGFGLDTLDGGAGIDTLDVTFFSGAYVLNLTTGVTNFVGETGINFENVNTGSGNDSITGSAADNVINTGSGNDTINGGNGNDILIGGAGTDRITDGGGDDIYKYFSTSESQVGVARDILTDFTPGFDKIDLSAIDSELSLLGNQAFKFIGTAAFTGGAGEVRYFASGSNLFVQAEINGDGNILADLEIQVNGLSTIAATNFIL
ncbi:M10 family metallopeptidase C-terminal domain-containing protein [Nostocales cyanobacterium LEGE 12452]|nr:M10 family metallopeptidase C-terminal domain-containing protein [Nostocales cyanobacterium LEGE 12452]